MHCGNCGCELKSGAKFCPNCGSQVESTFGEQPSEQNIEQNVQAPVDNNYDQGFDQGFVQGYETGYEGTEETVIEEKSSKKKNTIIGIVAIVLVAALIATGCYFIFFKKDTKKIEPIVYSTGSELFVIKSLGKDKDKCEKVKITGDYAGDYLFSENNKYIIYTTDRKTSDKDYDDYEETVTFNIYFKETFDEKSEPVLVAKNASALNKVIGEIDYIVYEKNGDVYTCNEKGDSNKIAKDTSVFGITEDNKYCYCSKYQTGDYDYETDEYGDSTYDLSFVEISSGDSTTICKGAASYDYSKDFKNICYLKGDKLYIYGDSNKETQIAKKVDNFRCVGDVVYYSCLNKEYTYYDFVDDKYKEADSKITYPEWEDYAPNESDYEKEVYDDYWEEYYTDFDYDAYEKAYEKAEEKYYKDLDAYEEAEDRLYLREALMEKSYYSDYTLYCFDGKNSSKVLADVSSSYIESASKFNYEDITTDAGIIMTYTKALSSLKKIDMDKVVSTDDISNYLDENVKYSNSLLINGKAIDLTSKEKNYSYSNILSTENEFIIFFTKATKDNNSYTSNIYSLPKNATSLDNAKLIIEGAQGIMFNGKNTVSFDELDYEDYTATMSVDKESIDDVYPYVFLQTDGDSGFYYATDFDVDDYTSTVYYYKNGKSTKIGEDILFGINGFAEVDGKFLAITDYDEDRDSGDLTVFDGENKYKLDSDVESVSSNFDVLYTVFAYSDY